MEQISTATLHGMEKEFRPLYLLQGENLRERDEGWAVFIWKVNSMDDDGIDAKYIWQHIRECQRYFLTLKGIKNFPILIPSSC